MNYQKIKKTLLIAVLFSLGNSVFASQLTFVSTDLDYYQVQDIKTLGEKRYAKQNVNAYLAGAVYNQLYDAELRSYFVFDLSGLSERVTNAKFRLFSNFNTYACAHRNDIGCGFASDDTSETLRFVDVQTSVASLMSPASGSEQAIFNDLGTGDVYGDITFTRDDVDVWLEIDLSVEALDKINQNSGLWAIASHVSTLDNPIAPAFLKQERLFIDHGVGVTPMPELVLTTVPVPTAVWLFGSGLFGLVGFSKRRS